MSQWDWWIGVDLGSAQHEVCILDREGNVAKQFRIDSTCQGLASMLDKLEAVTGGNLGSAAAALENNQGLVCDVLMDRGVGVHSLNPRQLDRFRDRHNVAGAKDDRLDALVLANSLRTDLHLFRRVEPAPAENLKLRELSRMLDELEEGFRQQANRLWSQLIRCYPELVRFCSGADEPWLWALIREAKTSDRLSGLSKKRLDTLLHRHKVRRIDPEKLHEALQDCGVHGDPNVAEACWNRILILVQQLELQSRLVSGQEEEIRRLLEPAARIGKSRRPRKGTPDAPLTDAEIVLSVKGIGFKTAAVLLGEAHREIRDGDYATLRAVCGTAPITRSSGKMSKVVMRRACNGRLRKALHHAAGVAARHVERWNRIYNRIRSRGGSHGRAVRQVGDKMLMVLCAMLRSRTLFDIDRLNGNASNQPQVSSTPRHKAS